MEEKCNMPKQNHRLSTNKVSSATHVGINKIMPIGCNTNKKNYRLKMIATIYKVQGKSEPTHSIKKERKLNAHQTK